MKALVTGANGFIGKHTCEFLAKKGHAIFAVVRSLKQAKILSETCCNKLVIDLSEAGSLKEAEKISPDMVVHLAATLPNSFFGEGAEWAAKVNEAIDRNVFAFCLKNGVGLIYASTSSIYGLGDGSFKVESGIPKPIGPYAVEKLEGEQKGLRVLSSSGLQFTSLRINAPYGPRQKRGTVLNLFIERAFKGLPLFYHGTGGREQDFTYVDDIAVAFALAAEKRRSGIFNITAGSPVSMKELAKLVVSCVPNCTSSVRSSGKIDPQEGVRALFSIERAKNELGWIPEVSLEKGLRNCIQARMTEGF